MKRLLRLLVASLVAALFICPGVVLAEEEKEKSVNEKMLDILIEKDIISKEQYEDLKKQAQKEEEAKKPKAVAGFDKGFYIETADKESRIKFDGRFHGDFKAYLGDHPDEDLLDQNYVDATPYTDEASGFTVGLNWYPNDMVRFMLNYNHIEFDDPISVDNETVDDEDVILTRFEVAL